MGKRLGLGVVGVWILLLSLGLVSVDRPVPTAPRSALSVADTEPKTVRCPESGLVPVAHSRTKTRRETLVVAATGSVSTGSGSVTVKATGYCSCSVCCGKSNGVTASGTQAHWGTIAAPRGWAFGSRYTISGLSGTFTVEDRGGAINGNRIDIWFPTHAEALAWGVRTVTLTPID